MPNAYEQFGASGGADSSDTEQVTTSFALVRALPIPPPAWSRRHESRSKVCYVDTNKNGICDNYENGACKGCAVGKGQGLQNGSGKGKSKGQGKGQRLHDGSCGGNGGKCANFVDDNNNGICDRRETVKK